MITGGQIRAARTALRWTAMDLAKEANLTQRTIIRLEACDGIPNSTVKTLTKVKISLESAGIEFIGTPDDGPGIRIYSAPSKT